MSVAPPNTQAIRSVNINKLTSTPPHPNEVLYVDIYTDPITKDKFILWDDILVAFHNTLHIRHKDTTPQQQQSSVLRQIEQQAARLLNHNPFSTMRPMSSNHLSVSVQNGRFAPPRNSFARTSNNNRQQLDESALRARNKALARKYASEAMVKVAAKMDLNALYAKGDGPPGDFWKALECYLKTVHQSHARAQVSVGDLFSEGQGVTRDTSVTLAKVCPKTMNKRCSGQGAPQDYVQAMNWYLKAANEGNALTQSNIGLLYNLGQGVPQHYAIPAAWYQRAADQGHIDAKAALKNMKKSGRIVD
ncbi:hypothetical protein BGZ89_008492 [Linnemannia elongata]|nr:hypothetical protein BGZ89_008492 [Linnemannia elongata]